MSIQTHQHIYKCGEATKIKIYVIVLLSNRDRIYKQMMEVNESWDMLVSCNNLEGSRV